MIKKITIITKKPWADYLNKAKNEANAIKIQNGKAKFTRKQIKEDAYLMAIEDLEGPYNDLLQIIRNHEVGAISCQFLEFEPSKEKPKKVVYRTMASVKPDFLNCKTLEDRNLVQKQFDKDLIQMGKKFKSLKWDATIE